MGFKKIIIFFAVVFLIALFSLGVRKFFGNQNRSAGSNVTTTEKNNTPAVAPETAKNQQNDVSTLSENQLFQPPLDRAGERVTKKPFGIFITPQNSPVQPERFSGYHTGTDFEIFPEELEADVPVKAVCGGKLLSVRTAGGYGGIAVQNCELDNEPISVLYGHLNIASVKFKVGEEIKAGDTLASLGTAYSAQTGGERKHLHLGIHKGSAIDTRGYVSSESELSAWLDPCEYACK